MKHKTHHSEFLNLNWQTNYHVSTRVLIGKGTVTKLPDLLSQISAGKKVLLLKQPNLFIDILENLQAQLNAKNIVVYMFDIAGGEACKSAEYLFKIWQVLHEQKFSRNDTIVAMGGGALTDMAGFAASTYLRGINLITIPTTLLAQVDAAIGGKTGINFNGGKNLIGNYYFAQAVIIDPETLSTLPREQFISGLAEVIKYALLERTIAKETEYIMGPKSLWEILEANVSDLDWDNDLLPGILIASIKMKLAVVAKDPYEESMRRSLNLGHTLGHALESISKFNLSHGQAVAIGIAFSVHLALANNQLNKPEASRIVNLLNLAGLPIKMPVGISMPGLLDYLLRDKKRLDRSIKMVLPQSPLGIVNYTQLIKDEEIKKELEHFSLIDY